MNSSARVGALVVLFAAMGIGALATLQASIFARQSREYTLVFADAAGLTPGSPVSMAGVQIGRVEEVALTGPSEAKARITVDEPHVIPAGSSAEIPTSFLTIGERQVLIIPGSGSPLAAGSEVPGRVRSALASLLPDADASIDNLNRTLAAVTKLLEDPDLKASTQRLAGQGEKLLADGGRLVRSGADAAESAGRLMNRFDRLAAGNERQLASVLRSTDRILQNVAAVSDRFRKVVEEGRLERETFALMKELQLAVEEGRTLVAELTRVAADPELQSGLKSTMANVSQMTESGAVIARNMEGVTAEGEAAAKAATKVMANADELITELRASLKKVEGALERFPGVGGTRPPSVDLQADLLTDAETGRIRTDLTASFQAGREKAIVGLWDAFESNKITLQLQRPLDQGLDLRYGVYASKPGVGVNYRIAPGLSGVGDLFGFNDTRLDLRLRYDFGRDLHGFLGFDRVFNSTNPVIGFGLRRRP
ncbi:MAG: MlaD family protein [Fimbriimonadaceae bacterium]|nr:MlaD family protein [Fimbriimonadaceae bacterium]